MNRLTLSYTCQFSRATIRGARQVALARLYSSSNYTENQYDVAIIGGGPAGLTLAAALASSPSTRGLKTVLVEGNTWSPPGPDDFDNRVVSLTPRSVAFLKKIGAWNNIATERVMPYEGMRVWDGVSGQGIEFDAWEDMAYMIENRNIQWGLLQTIKKNKAENIGEVKLLDKTKVNDISRLQGEEWPTISLDSGESIQARLIVGADGANSPARKYAQIEARGWPYNRFGFVATLKLEAEDFRNLAFQRFLPTGPIAMLPLPDGYASLVWSCTPEMAQILRSITEEQFTTLVNAAFRLSPVDIQYLLKNPSAITEDELEWRLENTTVDESYEPLYVSEIITGSRAGFPLRMQHADTYIADRVALVGDAAHTTHPLAGQGLNMGQQDVQALTEALTSAVDRGLDIGSQLALEPYVADRYLENHMKLGVVDKLHKLYSTDFGPLVQLRSWGLGLVNSLDFVKNELIKRASG